MKTRMLCIGLMVLFLSSCATQTARQELPPSDLAIFKAGITSLLQPRVIAGNIQYRDEAEDNWTLWNYAGNARDGFDLSEYDKARALAFTQQGLEIMEKSRMPTCKPWQLLCRYKQR